MRWAFDSRGRSSVGDGAKEDLRGRRLRARRRGLRTVGDGIATGELVECAKDDLVDIGSLVALVAILVEIEDLACVRKNNERMSTSERKIGTHSTQ